MSNDQDKTPKRGGVAPFHADGSAVSKRLRDALRERYQEALNEPVPDKLQSLIDRIKAAEQKKG
ncbi:NepR family anti-sigma factor [Hyphomonas oceanitis]|uniref:NepR family anti-sigma factor n=1 Tax=Hyphomonas oceanitis TaxID=81033 RepID=UPI0005573EFE|nr:NepR family anti-sigma factor [Hyphomonas oceanitis]